MVLLLFVLPSSFTCRTVCARGRSIGFTRRTMLSNSIARSLGEATVGLPLRSLKGPRAILFPAFGALIGAIGAGIYLGLPRGATALPIIDEVLIAALWGALAFAPHEDRRFGIASAISITASIAIRWFAIDALVPGPVVQVFIAAQTVPRAAVVAIAWASRPAAAGAGLAFSSTLTTPVALIAIAEGIAAA